MNILGAKYRRVRGDGGDIYSLDLEGMRRDRKFADQASAVLWTLIVLAAVAALLEIGNRVLYVASL